MHAYRPSSALRRGLRGGRRGALPALLLALSGCVSTSLVEHWRSPAFEGPPLHKVLVVALERDAGRRRVWESAMVDALMRQHVAATASYLLYPDQAPTAAQLVATAHREGFDGVFATHFVGAGHRSYWVPGYAGFGFGWGWPWFGWGPGPGYVESDYLASFQTDVFTIGPNGGRLIWSGVTRSVDLTSVSATTGQISSVLVPTLIHEHILAPS